MNKYTIIGIGGDISVIPYLSKLKAVLEGFGETSYICWDRDGVRLSSSNAILVFSPSNRVSLAFGYFVWVSKLFFYFLFSARKDRIYFPSRLDAALPIFLAGLARGRFNYVYLDRDAYFMTHNFGPLQNLVKAIEEKVASGALKHLVPGKSRDFTGLSNVEVVENTPSTHDLDCAKKISVDLKRDERFTIYVNGWLTKNRGAGLILNAAKRLDPVEFKFLVAGKIGCSEFEELIELPNVEYVGVIGVAESLAYYEVVDVVLAFYNPEIEVNRRAEPNKWYDCLFLGVPFITNNGIETVRLIDSDCYSLVDYGGVDQLVDIVKYMAKGELVLARYKNEYLPWDVKISSIVKSISRTVSK